MNVLFMTIAYPKAGEHNIYVDLMQEFERNGHQVYIACSNERRNGQKTTMSMEDGKNVIRIRIGNLTGNVNLIEKCLTLVLLESTFIKAIKTYFQGAKFDLIIYSTPPITFARAVEYFKKRDSTNTYLLLKDIFPQNAVDIGLIKDNSLIHKYFRYKEKRLYRLSDYIGCMSKANVDFVLRNNHYIPTERVEVCPNSISPNKAPQVDKSIIKKKYCIPDNYTTFLYGGNLGKPQGIDFIIKCLSDNMNLDDRFFIICGKGADFHKIETFYKDNRPSNMLLINGLPKKEYEELVVACDVGLIFLDHRFTIPNFPSRLLTYMEYAMPVIACTDANTDIGKVIMGGKFGWWCESNNNVRFKELIDLVCSMQNEKFLQLSINARKYLEDNYTTKQSYKIIIKHFV